MMAVFTTEDTQGYFSLIQYAEQPERLEFVNVGIFLLIKKYPHICSRFAENSSRIKSVFGIKPDAEFHNQLNSLKRHLQYDFAKKWDKNSVDHFINTRTGKFRLSPLRSVLLMTNPEALTEKLFKELVDAPKL